MKFRSKLVVGHTALLFVTLITGAVATIAVRVTTTSLGRVAHELAAHMIALERLRFEAEQVVAASRGFLLTGDPKTWNRFDIAVASVNESLARLDERRADLALDVAQIDDAAKSYVAAAESAARQRRQASNPGEVVPFFEQALAPARDRFEAALDRFVRREHAAFDEASERAREFASNSQRFVFAATTVSILLGVGLAWLSIRRLAAHYARERAARSAAQRAIAARDEMLAVVSHDLRNPLSAITMGSTLLSDTEDNPRVRKHASRIGSAATRMQHLIDQLLDIAQLENGKLVLQPEQFDIATVLDTITSLFEARAIDADIDLVANAQAGAAVLADRERVLQVLSNLVGNALKFTPAGGRIGVAARRDDGAVRFEVSDTGPGIPADQVASLFERYWQGRARGRGSLGLGLYICKQLVTALGGEIGVDSTVGAGSTFWFTLPAACLG